MSEAVAYIEHGWALCNIPAGTKGESGMDTAWNTEPNAIRDPGRLRNGWSVGLQHAWSRTCAVDIDKYAEAHAWLGARGVNLDALMAADDAVQIVSGRAGSAKLLYRLPGGVDPMSLVHQSIKDPEADPKDRAKSTWLELRCSSTTGNSVQDVLPPSIHPDTGKPYRWGGAGDWRALPELPAVLLDLWLMLADETPAKRKARGATGPGTSPEVMDAVRRVQALGLKPYRCGDGFRSFCPVHGGESGTTFKIDEAADGRLLVHCHAKCSQAEVLARLGPPDRAVPRNVSTFEMLKAAQDARKVNVSSDSRMLLPELPHDLLSLPGGLGQLQAWILGYMSHPSPAAAGFAAIATLAHFAMPRIGVASRSGLGLNEQFLLLAPTGFGKEDLRKPIGILTQALRDYRPPGSGNLELDSLPAVQHSAPASQQGLHCLLEQQSAQTFLADEFAEWLAHSAKDGHRQQAMGHAMQAYTKAYDTLAAPATTTRGTGQSTYRPIQNPRVLIFATSTAERLLEAITASQADSGALNRFVVLVAEQERLQKRYGIRPADYKPPREVVELVAWIVGRDTTQLELEPEAWQYHDAHDAEVLEDLSYRDPRLAKRLNEQAMKLAALIALGERRLTISPHDLGTAYAIREGLYHRAASLIGYDGALSGMHTTGRALEQLRRKLETRPFLYRSNLAKESRQFAALSLQEREAVMRALQVDGYARIDGGRFVSLIHAEAAP